MKRILVADQDLKIREEIARFIRLCGYEAAMVSDGETLIEQLNDAAPDLILLDIFLPPTSGLLVLKSLRSEEDTKDLPVLMMSSEDSEEASILSISSGANAFIIKPVRLAELTTKMQSVLDLARYKKQLESLNAQLAREKHRMRKYFSEDLVEKILNEEISTELGGSNVEASILFMDIRNSTGLAEKVGPARFAAFISDLFTELMELIFKNYGSVNKLLGDGILATFGCPEPSDDDAANAITTAHEMLDLIEEFNKRRPEYLTEPVRIGIGISTGKVFAGNIGSVRRIEYAVIGDPVNTASRLQDLTKIVPCNALIDGSTRQRLNGNVAIRPSGIQSIQGKSGPVEVFIFDGIRSK